MALFTICATTLDKTARACAVVQAVSVADAMRKAQRMRRAGDLEHVPRTALLTARRASRREAAALRTWMAARPQRTTALGSDAGFTERSNRRLASFFELLWSGRIEDAETPPALRETARPEDEAEFEYGDEDDEGAADILFDPADAKPH